jgi:hypothetical protein
VILLGEVRPIRGRTSAHLPGQVPTGGAIARRFTSPGSTITAADRRPRRRRRQTAEGVPAKSTAQRPSPRPSPTRTHARPGEGAARPRH